jgi:hypothetical protein
MSGRSFAGPLAPAFVNGDDLVLHLSENGKRNNEPQI